MSPGRGNRRRGAESAGGPGPGWGRGTGLPPSPPHSRSRPPLAPTASHPDSPPSVHPSRRGSLRPQPSGLLEPLPLPNPPSGPPWGSFPARCGATAPPPWTEFPPQVPPVRPCLFSLLLLGLTSPAFLGFPSDMPGKRVTREKARGDLGEGETFCLPKPWGLRFLTHTLLPWLVWGAGLDSYNWLLRARVALAGKGSAPS